MNATEEIQQALKGIMSDGEANACRIWKGYDVGTGETGWHYQRFGQTATYIGVNVAEALATLDDMTQEQADEHAEAMRGMRGRGRPRFDPAAPTVRTTIRLTQAQLAKAEELGQGNVGAGVRLAIERA
jgi:hypothetical protein